MCYLLHEKERFIIFNIDCEFLQVWVITSFFMLMFILATEILVCRVTQYGDITMIRNLRVVADFAEAIIFMLFLY